MCRETNECECGRILLRNPGRQFVEEVFVHRGELGKRTLPAQHPLVAAPHAVADLEPLTVRPDRFDRPRQIRTRYERERGGHLHQTAADVHIERIDAGRSHLHEHLARLRLWRGDFTVMDNLLDQNPNLPNSLYIGVKYFKKDLPHEHRSSSSPYIWKLDIHFVTSEDSRGAKVTQELKEKINDENRIVILELKDQLASHPKYRKEIFSMDIYSSVFDHNVHNLEEFRVNSI